MHQLIEQMFLPTFGTAAPAPHDAAQLFLPHKQIAFTTDSYVVSPLFFPGGDIGSMAVYGTVNDLAMAGARPLYLSLSFILEEGLPMETLWQVVQSIQRAAAIAGVKIVTGDTKVVDRGKGDGLFINTTGIGSIEHNWTISPQAVQPEDVILLNGDLGRHGIAIMAVREGLSFETTIESDSAPVADLVARWLDGGVEIHCLRDLTRGGLASAANEIAAATGLVLELEEGKIPLSEEVQGACEIMGLDPLYIANEGRFIAFLPPQEVEAALEIMNSYQNEKYGFSSAQIIGQVRKPVPPIPLTTRSGLVTLISRIGSHRILDFLSGEQLPRIC
jgi:hydrogenase expression/formation protein HypE